jgi:acyl-CoA synthetase (AMP-forming)/AMP-acid ligase II
VDGLVRQRAARHPDEHIVSYPRSGVEYVDYTLRQLDVFAWRAANWYSEKLPKRASSSQKPSVIALLGPSNLEYLITLLALTKLGHSVLFLSTRLSIPAIESLMKTTSASTIIGYGRHLSTAAEARKLLPTTEILDMVDRTVFEYSIEAHGDTRLDSHLDPEVETNNIAFIIHSSGMLTFLVLYFTHRC